MAERKQYVRLELIAVVLYLAGLIGRLVLQFTTNFAYSYPYAFLIQGMFYGAGLVVLFAEWLRSDDDGPEQRKGGCLRLLIVAALCGFALISTAPK